MIVHASADTVAMSSPRGPGDFPSGFHETQSCIHEPRHAHIHRRWVRSHHVRLAEICAGSQAYPLSWKEETNWAIATCVQGVFSSGKVAVQRAHAVFNKARNDVVLGLFCTRFPTAYYRTSVPDIISLCSDRQSSGKVMSMKGFIDHVNRYMSNEMKNERIDACTENIHASISYAQLMDIPIFLRDRILFITGLTTRRSTLLEGRELLYLTSYWNDWENHWLVHKMLQHVQKT